ncbi:MAG: hypothetical protein HYV09_18755 [Deltaproteobacteria bacterium]|nr:hypothetical protein [Deltaproteobacteria bacterium]
MRPERWARAIGLAAVALFAAATGCSTTTQNVRAYRAYAAEDTSLKVAFDRIQDLARSLDLVDRILLRTTYTPGDLWVRRLPITDAEYRARKERIKAAHPYNTGEFEVPVLKVIKEHCESVLDEFRPPLEKAAYPSILAAASALTTRAPALEAHWAEYRDATEAFSDAFEEAQAIEEELAGRDEATKKARAGELAEKRKKLASATARVERSKAELARDAALLESDAKLSDPQKKQLARDVLTVVSVAFRIELEAIALTPIVIVQTVRAIPQAPRELVFKPTLKMVRQAWQLPTYVSGIKERFLRQVVVLEGLTKILATALKTSVDDSPGFALTESVVDQIVGITLDSFRLDVKAGGEAFIFSSIATAAQQSSSSEDGSKTETVDYRGRSFKLDYRVQPIILTSARLDLVLDWIRLPGVFQLGFGYSTDRVYKSGGEIEHSSLSKQLGLKSAASDVFDIGLGLLGIRSSARIARFTGGEVRQVQATDIGTIVARAPLQLEMTQIDVGYDILFALADEKTKSWLEELVLGVRYFRYQLPRILYELRNTSTDPNHKTFVFSRESPIQPVESRYYMGGFTARAGVGEAPRFSPWFDMSLFGGAGPSSFYFLRDPLGGDVPDNREPAKTVAWVVNGGLGIGLRWRLLPRGFRARLDLRASYRADFVYTSINRDQTVAGEERRTDFGSVDVFHGPAIAIRGAL